MGLLLLVVAIHTLLLGALTFIGRGPVVAKLRGDELSMHVWTKNMVWWVIICFMVLMASLIIWGIVEVWRQII